MRAFPPPCSSSTALVPAASSILRSSPSAPPPSLRCVPCSMVQRAASLLGHHSVRPELPAPWSRQDPSQASLLPCWCAPLARTQLGALPSPCVSLFLNSLCARSVSSSGTEHLPTRAAAVLPLPASYGARPGACVPLALALNVGARTAPSLAASAPSRPCSYSS